MSFPKAAARLVRSRQNIIERSREVHLIKFAKLKSMCWFFGAGDISAVMRSTTTNRVSGKSYWSRRTDFSYFWDHRTIFSTRNLWSEWLSHDRKLSFPDGAIGGVTGTAAAIRTSWDAFWPTTFDSQRLRPPRSLTNGSFLSQNTVVSWEIFWSRTSFFFLRIGLYQSEKQLMST